VLTADRALPLIQPGDHHIRDPQIIQTDGCGHNIHDGIHRAHFMEMHLILRHAVSFCFCRRQNPEDAGCSLFCAFRQICMFDDVKDLGKSSVFMSVSAVHMMCLFRMSSPVCMGTLSCMSSPVCVGTLSMHMEMFLRMHVLMPVQIFHIVIMILMGLIQHHIKITHVKSRFLHPADHRMKSVHRKTLKRPFKRLLIRSQIQKRRHRHIAADSALTFQI
jgi:hypothetical protein